MSTNCDVLGAYHSKECTTVDYIPLRGCIKVAARGLKRTKVPCDYVMRTILSFMVPRCKGHGLPAKNLV